MEAVMKFLAENFAVICLVAGMVVGMIFVKAFKIGLQLLEISEKAGSTLEVIEAVNGEYIKSRSIYHKVRAEVEKLEASRYYRDKVELFEGDLLKIKERVSDLERTAR